MIEFSPISIDSGSLQEYSELFSVCFPKSHKFTVSYLEWLYASNPDGKVVGFNAFNEGRLVAHYACIPARVAIRGQPVLALLSLNTATLPDFQGKGLFTKLAELTYESGVNLGFDCVYGVANANSTPGFVRKLKFQLVAQLRACIGMGKMTKSDPSHNRLLDFQRIWNKETLQWRCANPINKINVRHDDNFNNLSAPIVPGFLSAGAELYGVQIQDTRSATSPFRLFLGLTPPAMQSSSFYIDVPGFMRPSPLNLIYRSLSAKVPLLNAECIFFSFLDFDAY